MGHAISALAQISAKFTDANLMSLKHNPTLLVLMRPHVPYASLASGFKPQSKVFTALKPPGGHLVSASGSGALGSDMGESGGAWLEQLPAVLARLERQRKVGRAFAEAWTTL